ncbi:MAG: AAA family ATPase [bacterium]|nr:AAA family ATPase [bacterium]
MSEPDDGPWLVVLAGPNGAGKSTFFDVFLRQRGFRFVNADLIARSLPAPERADVAYRAAELAAIARRALVERGDTFVLETVFSDPVGAKLDFLRAARARGYRIAFVYVGLDGVPLSQARVCQRVAQGGHDVPDAKLRRRLPRSLANARAALAFVDAGWVLDNSDAARPFVLVARTRGGRLAHLAPHAPVWCRRILPKTSA